MSSISTRCAPENVEREVRPTRPFGAALPLRQLPDVAAVTAFFAEVNGFLAENKETEALVPLHHEGRPSEPELETQPSGF